MSDESKPKRQEFAPTYLVWVRFNATGTYKLFHVCADSLINARVESAKVVKREGGDYATLALVDHFHHADLRLLEECKDDGTLAASD